MKHTYPVVIVFGLLCISVAAADSLQLTLRVPAKEYAYCTMDLSSGTINAVSSSSSEKITARAQEAIAYAPDWLSLPLEDRFSRLNSALQDTLAQIILDAVDPYVDELAFTIAYMPQEVVMNREFHTVLFRENAEGIYRADSGLEYVTIVDSGSATIGGDYYSTTQYTVVEEGKELTYTLPREMYYWYIVHPKLQGELPAYITPDNPNPTTPIAGKFWRTYLWEHKEPAYSALCDTMNGISFLWANKINSPAENGALGRLSQWCNTILPWGGHPQYRWPQPVYLYNQHCGTCSEHGWFASAAARTALIPATLTKAARLDHKWNEFFYRRWIDWEPINGWIARIDEPNHANDYWSDPAKPALSGCFNWRGDGFIWGTTEHYSPVCTLSVAVSDEKRRPVDGARVTIDAAGEPGNFLIAGWTGSDGYCQFLLGDKIASFTAAVHSSLGDLPATQVINNSVSGGRYTWSPVVAKTATLLNIQPVESVSGVDGPVVKIRCTLAAPEEYVYGRHEYALFGYSFPCTFSDTRQTGTVDVFLCDEPNFTKHRMGEPFSPRYYGNDLRILDTVFTVPAAMERWYIIVSGEEKQNTTSLVDLTVTLQSGSKVHPQGNHTIQTVRPAISTYLRENNILVDYTLPQGTACALYLHSVSGMRIRTLFKGFIHAGTTSHLYSLVNVPAGVYWLSIRSALLASERKIVRVR